MLIGNCYIDEDEIELLKTKYSEREPNLFVRFLWAIWPTMQKLEYENYLIIKNRE